MPDYPYIDGDEIVLGPEVFASAAGDVICWKGRNYVPQENFTAVLDGPGPDPANWSCQIGEIPRSILGGGLDLPMRKAVEVAYREVTGHDADFIFSGWGDPLSEIRRAVHEDRPPLRRRLSSQSNAM